jgi:hypothetical protein
MFLHVYKAQVCKLASHHEFTTKDVMVKRHKTLILHFLLSFKVDGRMTPHNKLNPLCDMLISSKRLDFALQAVFREFVLGWLLGIPRKTEFFPEVISIQRNFVGFYPDLERILLKSFNKNYTWITSERERQRRDGGGKRGKEGEGGAGEREGRDGGKEREKKRQRGKEGDRYRGEIEKKRWKERASRVRGKRHKMRHGAKETEKNTNVNTNTDTKNDK